MKIERYFTSGTGNGVDAVYYKEFVDALQKEIRFLQLFVKYYKKTGSEKMFGGKWYALNNWHGEYKIESSADKNFPFEMVNRVGFNSWGDIELGIVIPMKFKARSWDGSGTDEMKAVFKTHCNVRNLKSFIEEYKLPPHILREVLLAAKDFYQDRIEKYKEHKNTWIDNDLEKLNSLFTEQQEITNSIKENIEELKEIEKLLTH